MGEDALLFLHLVGVLLLVGGGLTARVLRIGALRRGDPPGIAVLLRAARMAVPLVGIGLVTAIGFGTWLAHRLGYSFGSGWLTATYALLGWMLVAGAVAGRQDRHIRELAERLAAGAGDPAPLLSRLRDPVNLALNTSLLGASFAVVALMVWKP
jgi:uncharacterized membrane protein